MFIPLKKIWCKDTAFIYLYTIILCCLYEMPFQLYETTSQDAKTEKSSQFAKTALLLLHNLEHDGEACHVEDALHGGLHVDDFERAACCGDGFVGCKE